MSTVANYAARVRRRVGLTGGLGSLGGVIAVAGDAALRATRFLAGVRGASATGGVSATARLRVRGFATTGADGTAAGAAAFFDVRFLGAGVSTTWGSTCASTSSVGVVDVGAGNALVAAFLARFGFASTVASAGSTLTVVIVGIARSMLRRAGAKLSTTKVIDSPIFMNSRALRGSGSDIRLSGT